MTGLMLSLYLSAALPGQLPPAPLPAPGPLLPSDELPLPVPTPAYPPVIGPSRPMTPAEFMAVFRPIPGTHKVTLIHPGCKGNVVDVCFTLPDCPLCDVKCRKRSITFDYGKHEVEIVFRLFGKVDVQYR
jgi:hypothetical protein